MRQFSSTIKTVRISVTICPYAYVFQIYPIILSFLPDLECTVKRFCNRSQRHNKKLKIYRFYMNKFWRRGVKTRLIETVMERRRTCMMLRKENMFYAIWGSYMHVFRQNRPLIASFYCSISTGLLLTEILLIL